MKPGVPAAERRFETAINVFTFLLKKHAFLKHLARKDKLRIIDVAAGTGIAGAALAYVAASQNKLVELIVTDARSSDLPLVHGWLKKSQGVYVKTIVSDATNLYESLKDYGNYFDVAILWGLSSPHFDPWKMARIYASVSYLLSDKGTMVLEEVDRVLNIFYKVGYKDFLPQVTQEGGKTIVSVHLGYNIISGTFQRAYYILPGFREVSKLSVRLWDIAGISALGWMFFRDVDIVGPDNHKVQGGNYVILLTSPRRSIEPYDLSEEPSMLKSK
jgi:predicted RNA methylase